jgi:DNA-binding MurR/RpiR family transcriptional regulator
MMRPVAETVRLSLDRLTPTERRVAMVLLATSPVAGLETIAQFARRAGVSGPTILRLVGKLGFHGYPDFQRALRDELEVRLQSPLTKHAPAAPNERSPRDPVDVIGQAIVENIRASLRDVSRTEIAAVVDLLADAGRPVRVLGGRFTQSVALQLFLHLREMRPGVGLVSGQTATWVEHLLDMGRRDVLVVFDIRRYQDDVVRFAQQAAARRACIVLFTDQWLSPVAAVARHVFTVRTRMPSNWESFAALGALVEVLVAALNDQRWDGVKRRIETLEDLRARLRPD